MVKMRRTARGGEDPVPAAAAADPGLLPARECVGVLEGAGHGEGGRKGVEGAVVGLGWGWG